MVKWLPLGNNAKDPVAGATCLVAGWGVTDIVAKKISDVLKSVNVTVIDRVKCNSPKYYGLRPVITRGMICAGSNGQNKADTCQVSVSPTFFVCMCVNQKRDTSHMYSLARGIQEAHCCAMER